MRDSLRAFAAERCLQVAFTEIGRARCGLLGALKATVLVATIWVVNAHAAPAQTASTANVPPGQLPPPIYTRQMAFSIPFQVGTSARPGEQPAEIQLYTSVDRGRKWSLVRTLPPAAGAFAVRAPGDGEYWFCVRTKDASGVVRPTGEPQPGMRVIIDTSAPEPKLNAWRGGAGELNAQWEVRDANLDPSTLQLEYRVDDGPWQPVAFERLPPGSARETYVGMTTWLPDVRAENYEVRVQVRDRAGNPTVHRTLIGSGEGSAVAANPGLEAASPGHNWPGHHVPPTTEASPVGMASVAGTSQALPETGAGGNHTPQAAPFPSTGEATAGSGSLSQTLPPVHGYAAPAPQTIPREGIAVTEVPSGNAREGDWTATPSKPIANPYVSSSLNQGTQVTLLPELPGVPRHRRQGDVPALDPITAGRQNSLYTSTDSGAVSWPVDRRSIQPLDRSPLSPQGGMAGGSSVQFQNMEQAGQSYASDIDAAGGRGEGIIRYQESNTGGAYRPPIHAVDAAYAATTPSAAGNLPSAARRPWMVRSRTFELKYDLTQSAAHPQRVELWGTTDAGQHWQRFAVDADGRSPVHVTVPSEGLYGFKLVAQNNQGLVEFPPARGDEPDVWIQVDVTRPSCRLTRAEQSAPPRDSELTIEWEAADVHLGPQAVTLEYARTLQGPWIPIAVDVANTGRHVWQMPERTPGSFHLRLQVRDQAGNVGEFITAEAVTPVRSNAGRILDVNPTAEPLRTGRRGQLYQFR